MFPTKILSSKELKVLVGEMTQTRRLSGIPRALSPGIPKRGQRCVTFSNILKKRSGVSSSPVVTYLHILRSPTSALLLGKPRTGLTSPEIQFLTLVRMGTCILTMAGLRSLRKLQQSIHSYPLTDWVIFTAQKLCREHSHQFDPIRLIPSLARVFQTSSLLKGGRQKGPGPQQASDSRKGQRWVCSLSPGRSRNVAVSHGACSEALWATTGKSPQWLS